jgi:hypothetical protein
MLLVVSSTKYFILLVQHFLLFIRHFFLIPQHFTVYFLIQISDLLAIIIILQDVNLAALILSLNSPYKLLQHMDAYDIQVFQLCRAA